MVRNGFIYKEIENIGFGEVIDADGDMKTAVSEALDRLLSRRGEWETMGVKARRLYEEKYPWSKSEKALLDGYRSLV